MKRWRRFVVAAFIVCALPPGLIAVDGLTDEPGRSDVAIVLGNTVNANGTPSPRLKARLDRALELYKAGQAPNIIVSGGPGREGRDEATAMRLYLIVNGVPKEAVIPDSLGVNTMATAVNSAAIMQARGWTSATAVSQFYHIPRTRMALKAKGVATVHTAHARGFTLHDLYGLARDTAAYAKYWWQLTF